MPIAQIPTQVQQNIDVPIVAIADFCDRCQIIDFALFASVRG